jgi:hypothetical protein
LGRFRDRKPLSAGHQRNCEGKKRKFGVFDWPFINFVREVFLIMVMKSLEKAMASHVHAEIVEIEAE